MLDGALHRLRSILFGSLHLDPASAPSVHGSMAAVPFLTAGRAPLTLRGGSAS
jgi:hypothetical protein